MYIVGFCVMGFIRIYKKFEIVFFDDFLWKILNFSVNNMIFVFSEK